VGRSLSSGDGCGFARTRVLELLDALEEAHPAQPLGDLPSLCDERLCVISPLVRDERRRVVHEDLRDPGDVVEAPSCRERNTEALGRIVMADSVIAAAVSLSSH
jgi:hypothetical protein